MTNKKQESKEEKKIRLLNEFVDFLEEKAKAVPYDDDHFIIDDTVPKGCMILTNHDTGERLLLKSKIENNKLTFEEIKVLPKLKKNKI
jgi:hypothetical protein